MDREAIAHQCVAMHDKELIHALTLDKTEYSDEFRIQAMRELAADGRVAERFAASDDPLGFLVHDGGATSVIDAAYRFVRHTPGVDVVLTGTSDVDHLGANVASILKPPLPAEDLATLRELFGDLAGFSLDPPTAPRRS